MCKGSSKVASPNQQLINESFNPTAAQRPTAAPSNTMSVCRYLRSVSQLIIHHQGWSRGGGVNAYTPTTPHQPSPSARKKKLTTFSPHGVLLLVAVPASARNSTVIPVPAVTVCLSMYPTLTTQRLWCVQAALPKMF